VGVSPDDNRETAGRLFAAWERWDLETVGSLLGEGPVHIVGVVELAGGKVVKADFYFAEPFDPPAARERWASGGDAGDGRTAE
jgi:hypothetical protein